MSTVKVNCISWNCRGLNRLAKVKQVMSRIKFLGAKIAFLQETHLSPGDTSKIRRRWPGQVFSASHSSSARGVIILIHKSVPMQIQDVVEDPAGRFLIIHGFLLHEEISLINVYGPNGDDPAFYRNLFLKILTFPGKYIMAGDFNCTLDPAKDRSSGVDVTHVQSRKTIQCFIQEINLLDIWRHLNPNAREYSCFSGTHQTYSRIDYFYNLC